MTTPNGGKKMIDPNDLTNYDPNEVDCAFPGE